jgi:hypothetical protein
VDFISGLELEMAEPTPPTIYPDEPVAKILFFGRFSASFLAMKARPLPITRSTISTALTAVAAVAVIAADFAVAAVAPVFAIVDVDRTSFFFLGKTF